MAIRFQCGSCSQPIEVDDEWAVKAVACPYCRKTITAPAESTLDEVQQVPVATGLQPAQPDPPTSAPAVSQADLALLNHPNTIAKVALILACVQVMLLVSFQVICASHRLELEEFVNAMVEAGTMAGMMKAQSEFYEARGGIPQWMITITLLQVMTGLAWIAGLVCSLIGVRRIQRRGLAVAALAITGLIPILFCCGGAFY